MTRRRLPVNLSDRAKADREGITVYGIETWGEEQAERYVAALDRATDGLAEHSEIGRARPDLGPGVRSVPVGEHVVYYRTEPDEIQVTRILHARQDPSRAAGI